MVSTSTLEIGRNFRKGARAYTQTNPPTGPLTTFSSPSSPSSACGTASNRLTTSLVALGPARSIGTSSVSRVRRVAPSGSADEGAWVPAAVARQRGNSVRREKLDPWSKAETLTFADAADPHIFKLDDDGEWTEYTLRQSRPPVEIGSNLRGLNARERREIEV